MSTSTLIISILVVYLVTLLGVALYTERRYAQGKDLTNNSFVYAMSLCVYATAWTFFGNVGVATTSYFLYLGVYIGPALTMIFLRPLLVKLIKLKNEYGVASVADFIAARYDKSVGVGAIATAIAVFGLLPYYALQFKAVFLSLAYIMGNGAGDVSDGVRLFIVASVTLLVIAFGFRSLEQTERRPGMVMVVAIQSVVKLFAFLAAGIFIVYYLYDGAGDIMQKIMSNKELLQSVVAGRPSASTWISYIILSMSAILFLPRQFHLAVIENANIQHIKTASWALPLYLFLITLFVFPIAMVGLLGNYDASLSDIFILVIPSLAGHMWLSILVFIGGLSAAMSMIVVSTVAVTTMVNNNFLVPIIDRISLFGFLKKYMLPARWVVVALILLSGYAFETLIGSTYLLVKIGIISFAAVFQFAPALIGGLYWERGNRAGAIMGLCGGLFVWGYTSLFPALIRSGFFSLSILTNGPFNISWLRPEQLFGITALDPLAVTVLYSFILNGGLYILGSVLFEQSKEEHRIAFNFVNISGGIKYLEQTKIETKESVVVDVEEKRAIALSIFNKYISQDKASEVVMQCMQKAKIYDKKKIDIKELIEFANAIEGTLSSYIGAPAASGVMARSKLFNEEETKELSLMYADIASGMKMTPAELIKKIDFYTEKEKTLTSQREALERMVAERTKELVEKNNDLTMFRDTVINRELKMIELKKRIEELEEELARWGRARGGV